MGFCIFLCEVFETFHFHLVPSYGHSRLRSFGLFYYLMTETETSFETWTSTFFSHIRDKVCQPKGDEVTGEWIKLHNGELNGLYSSPNILWVIKSRRMSWSGHIVRMGECREAQKVWCVNLEEREHLEEPGVDGKIILRWIFRKWDVGAWNWSIWLRIETIVGGCCKSANETWVP